MAQATRTNRLQLLEISYNHAKRAMFLFPDALDPLSHERHERFAPLESSEARLAVSLVPVLGPKSSATMLASETTATYNTTSHQI